MPNFDFWRLWPAYWLQNCPTDWEWDATLNSYLDRHEPKLDSTGHTTRIGPVEVWVRNWPYAFGSPYSPVHHNVLPSVSTRKRLRRVVRDAQAKAFRAALENIDDGHWAG
ncbi:hypothetical protein [Erythrobacter phage vB_EliS-L02]|nr:hypothetical protein [Erythrobacter phage vB_EliS-L02]